MICSGGAATRLWYVDDLAVISSSSSIVAVSRGSGIQAAGIATGTFCLVMVIAALVSNRPGAVRRSRCDESGQGAGEGGESVGVASALEGVAGVGGAGFVASRARAAVREVTSSLR